MLYAFVWMWFVLCLAETFNTLLRGKSFEKWFDAIFEITFTIGAMGLLLHFEGYHLVK